MYIIYDNENNIKQLRSKYLLLELDTVEITDGKNITSYCVIDREHIALEEMSQLELKKNLHGILMNEYKEGNWNTCLDSLGHLRGSFRGELDSFYKIMNDRILGLKDAGDDPSWSPVITKKNN